MDAPLGGDQLERCGVLAHLDALVIVDVLQERPEDVRAGRGVDVKDTELRMGGLARIVKVAVGGLVEVDLERVDEHVLDGVVGVVDKGIDSRGIGGAVAGRNDVFLEALGIVTRCRDTALCPVGTGVGGFRRFRQQEHVRALSCG